MEDTIAKALDIIERSKLDNEIIAGSEIRDVLWVLIGAVRSGEAQLASIWAHHDKRADELRAALGGD